MRKGTVINDGWRIRNVSVLKCSFVGTVFVGDSEIAIVRERLRVLKRKAVQVQSDILACLNRRKGGSGAMIFDYGNKLCFARAIFRGFVG